MSSHPLYWVALQQALGESSRKIHALLKAFETPELVFEATKEQLEAVPGLTGREVAKILAKPYLRAKEIWYQCKEHGIFMITPEDDLFPDSLRNIPDMPCVLYYKGDISLLSKTPCISLIGTRKPSEYGQIVTRQMASVLAVAGVTVVSGGAKGLDSIAHGGALSVGGKTVAVLGCGLQVKYLENIKPSRAEIAGSGLLMSEYPPMTPASRYTFPARNRLIAALSLGTVVIEAGEKSGTLITADFALQQGKDVFALPGNVMSPGYKGSNRIISDGAIPVFSGLDILAYYEYAYKNTFNMGAASRLHRQYVAGQLLVQEPEQPPEQPQNPKTKSVEQPNITKKIVSDAGKDLSEACRRVYNMILDAGSITLADLVDGLEEPTHVVLERLTDLELEGLITRTATGNYNITEEE